MATDSKIQWTDHTWNPWHGCRKVSAGCKYCYMYRDKEMHKQDPTLVVRGKTTFNQPLGWKEPARVFTCSWSDFFIEEADAWRPEAWEIIKRTPHLTYQILTKRPERIAANLPPDWGDGYTNVWLGVSCEDQEMAMKRIPILIEIPAAVRFLSVEPMIGPILMNKLDERGNEYTALLLTMIHWIIIGGESGNDSGLYRYRFAQLRWFEELISQCQLFAIPVFVKQLGTFLSKELKLTDRHGGNINEWPEHLKIREFPKL